MASNISITNLPQVNTLGDNDVIPVVAMGKTSKITYPALVSQIQSDTNVTWETLTGKIFEDIDSDYFKTKNITVNNKSVSVLTVTDRIAEGLSDVHTHNNKQVLDKFSQASDWLMWDNIRIATYSELSPINTKINELEAKVNSLISIEGVGF